MNRPWSDAYALVFLGAMAALATTSGVHILLFPELGALTQNVLAQPHGRWASRPLLLVLTPTLTALLGVVLAMHWPFGLLTVLTSVLSSWVFIRVLRSPVVPAISAGLLPIVFGIHSFDYPASVALGTGLLALWVAWTCARTRQTLAMPAARPAVQPLSALVGVICFVLFLCTTTTLALAVRLPLLLCPPLVVMAFEMLIHPKSCPWSGRPATLWLACTGSAAIGQLALQLLGHGPLSACAAYGLSLLLLKSIRLQAPPVLAIGLVPWVLQQSPPWVPAWVAVSAALMLANEDLRQRLIAPAAN